MKFVTLPKKGIELFEMGECQDFALFLYYFNKNLDLDLVFINDNNSNSKTSLYHAMVYDGIFYYDVSNRIYEDDINDFIYRNYAYNHNFTIYQNEKAIEKFRLFYGRDLTNDLNLFLSYLEQKQIEFQEQNLPQLCETYQILLENLK